MQVTVMVTLTYPEGDLDVVEQEMIGEKIEEVLNRELECRGFPGCSQIEAETEEDV